MKSIINKMTKLVVMVLVVAMSATAVACTAKQEKTQVDKIKESGKLVVGTEAQYAPYEFKDMNQNFVGVDMWLAKQIADELGVSLEVVDMSFSGIIPAVQAEQVNLGIAAFTKEPERAKIIDFSDVYEASEQVLIVKKDNASVYTSKESLVGLKVAAQKGSLQSSLIKTALPDSVLFELDKYPSLALEVENDNIAGLIVDKAVGESLIENSQDKLAIADFTFTSEEANFGKAVVIKKGSDALLEIVNKVIAKVTSDGTYEAEFQKAVDLAKSMGL